MPKAPARPGTRGARPGPAVTRSRILDAAARCFAQRGARRTTVTDVARDAGCARATVYLHFPGREALYRALLEREADAFVERLESAVAGATDAPRKLRAVLRAAAASWAEHRVLRDAAVEGAASAVERVAEPVVRHHERRVTRLLRSILEKGVAAGVFRPHDTGVVADLMLQLGSRLVTREMTGRRRPGLRRSLEVMEEVFARGIGAGSWSR